MSFAARDVEGAIPYGFVQQFCTLHFAFCIFYRAVPYGLCELGTSKAPSPTALCYQVNFRKLLHRSDFRSFESSISTVVLARKVGIGVSKPTIPLGMVENLRKI